MNFQRIFVLGAGAIGSSYGALLSRKNHVTLIARKEHVDAINTEGLKISGHLQERFHVEAQTAIRKVPPDALILLTTKAHDSRKALTEAQSLLEENTVIVILQNGLGNTALVRGIIGDKMEVVRGLVMMGAEFLGPGKVAFWAGETILEQTRTSGRIAKLFNDSGLKTRISKEFEKDLWHKLIVNCTVNPLTAILKSRTADIAGHRLREIRHRIIDECVSVGRSEKIFFEPDLKEAIDRKIAQYTNLSSMYQDLMKIKKTEIEFLNGKIVELGRKHHIPTPINETLVALVKSLEGKPK